MRKISKGKTEDDVISSTNGSIANEDPDKNKIGEADNADAGNNAEDAEDELPTGGSVAASEDSVPKSKKKTKGKSTKRKLTKGSSKYIEDDLDDDDANSVKEVSKKKSRSSRKKDEGDEEEEEEEYEVEKIIDSKHIKGKLHYLIRWKGYSAKNDTWEPKNTLSCPDLIDKFEENKGKPTTKGGKKGKGAKKGGAKKPKLAESDEEDGDETAEYEVDKILEVHKKKNGDRDFLIHWKGWASKYDSWEPESHLNCSELIEKFMEKVDNAKSVDPRSLRVAPGSTKRFTLQAQSSARRLSKRRGQKQRVRYDDAE